MKKPTVRISLQILGETVAVESPQPPAVARIDELLPFFQAIDNAAVDRAVAVAEGEGKTVSCSKGCAACCKAQPVPVTPAEAYSLYRLVRSMPEPRRSEVKKRFAENVTKLTEAGLKDEFFTRKPGVTPAEARELARSYFALGLWCPFLENDACAIYLSRPFVCRQYLVTSPAANCDNPFENPIEQVKMPIAAAGAMLAVMEEKLGKPQHTVPLALALEYATTHRDELERSYPSEGIAKGWLSHLVSEKD